LHDFLLRKKSKSFSSLAQMEWKGFHLT
jgi:hypothetical protein